MKMKKVMAGLLAGLMAFSMVACGNKSASAEKTDAKDTNNDGKFVVGFDQDFPPMGFVGDDGEYGESPQAVERRYIARLRA